MKYDINEAVREIERRSTQLKKKRYRRTEAILSSITAALIIMIAGFSWMFLGNGVAAPEGSVYGSFLLTKEAGGYVLVGVICFVLAVIITIICNRISNNRHDKDKQNSQTDRDNNK